MVVDADDVARAVTAPGEPAHDAVVRQFGAEVTTADGTLDRAALARIVFADPAGCASSRRSSIPRCARGSWRPSPTRRPAGAARSVIEAIKLVEGGLANLCDEVWLVTCDAATQRERLLARGTAPEDAERRMAAQAGLADRLAPAATRDRRQLG